MKVRNIMTSSVATIGMNETITDASRIMEMQKVNCLVVMGGRSAVGMITDSDITRYVVSKGLDPKQTKTSEIMSSPLIFVSPDDTVERVAEILTKHKINRLVVVENGNLVGIITDADISKIKSLARLEKTHETSAVIDSHFFEGMTKRPDWDRGSGFCDNCGNHEDNLVISGDERLCRNCLEKKRSSGGSWVSRKKSGSSFTG